MPPTSVLRSRQPFELFLQPVVVVPLPVTAPPATPLLLPGKPPSLGPDCPYCRSISRPSTALTRPTSKTKSGRNRVRAYHRSEEHTSELQSPCNLVCRLLLEKKKKPTR